MKVEAPTYAGHGKPSLKQAVNSKLKILEEFFVYDCEDAKARDQYKKKLLDEVAKYPNRDYEIVLDQIGTQIIMDRLA